MQRRRPHAHRSATLRTSAVPPSRPLPEAVPRGHVLRQRLLDRLDLGAPVTLLAAGAGWGKTALLRQAAGHAVANGRHVAWVDLVAHTDEERFWHEIGRAVLSAVQPGAHRSSTGDLLRSDDVVATLTGRSTVDAGLVLVIDDLQRVEDPEVVTDFLATAARLGPGVQVLLGTRHRPTVADAVALLGPSDLRFTIDEVRALLTAAHVAPAGDHPTGNDPTGDDPTGDDPTGDDPTGHVVESTEGWPALVRIAAHSLALAQRAHRAGWTAHDVAEHVHDYVHAQVVAPLPADLQALLLDVSVLDRLTLDGCAAVSGSGSVGLGLDRLARHGVPMDRVADGAGLRLHPAVRAAARARLARDDRARWNEVHRRAARHLLDTDAPLAAVDHLLELGDHATAAGELVRHHRRILGGESMRAIGSRLARFPVSLARSSPDVAIDVAALHTASGGFGAAARMVAALRQVDLDGGIARRRAVVAAAVDGILADVDRVLVGGGPHDEAAVASEELLADIWPAGPISLLLADRFDECAAACHRAERADAASAAHPTAVLAARAFMSAWRGHLGEAATSIASAQALDVTRSLSPLERMRLASAELLLRLERDDPRRVALDASRLAQDASEHMDRHSCFDVPAAVIALRAWRLAGESWRAFDGTLPLVSSTPTIARPWLTSLLSEALVRCACDVGDLVAAERALAQVRGPLATTLARARVLIARHETAAARTVLSGLDLHRLAAHSAARAIELGAMQYSTATTSRELAATLDVVGAIADEHGLRRSLEAALGRATGSAPHRPTGHPHELQEPLSARELEVLRLLPTELPAAELAAQLFVSVNTMKTHLKSVYRKLGATGRSDAVRRAQELGVLPPRA